MKKRVFWSKYYFELEDILIEYKDNGWESSGGIVKKFDWISFKRLYKLTLIKKLENIN